MYIICTHDINVLLYVSSQMEYTNNYNRNYFVNNIINSSSIVNCMNFKQPTSNVIALNVCRIKNSIQIG